MTTTNRKRDLRRLCVAALALLTVTGCKAGPEPRRTTNSYAGLESAARPDGYRYAPPPFNVGPPRVSKQHVSAAGMRFIESFEGFSSCPYWDRWGKVWTRGYGETEAIGRTSKCITRRQGEFNLRTRIEFGYEWALRALKVSLNQNRWDALASFAWNLGAGIFTGTALGDHLRHQRWRNATTTMLLYTHAGGVELPGLVRRRRAEVALFNKPTINRVALEQRRAVLRRYLQKFGCRRRKARHERLGPKCQRWFREGDAINARLRA